MFCKTSTPDKAVAKEVSLRPAVAVAAAAVVAATVEATRQVIKNERTIDCSASVQGLQSMLFPVKLLHMTGKGSLATVNGLHACERSRGKPLFLFFILFSLEGCSAMIPEYEFYQCTG